MQRAPVQRCRVNHRASELRICYSDVLLSSLVRYLLPFLPLALILWHSPALRAESLAFHFLSPLEQAQVIGPTVLEVTTSIESVDRVEFFVDGRLVGVMRKPPFRIIHDFGESLESHNVTATLFHDAYRKRTSAEVRTAIHAISDQLTVDLVELAVRLDGSSANPEKDLVVREDGQLQEILEVRSRRSPTTFLFVIDRSMSMGHGKLTASLRAVERMRGRIRPQDQARIILFNHRPDKPVDIDSLPELQKTIPSGGTALLDTLAGLRPQRSSIVIVVSDGGDRNSLTETSEALRTIGRNEVTIFALLLDKGSATDFLLTATGNSGGMLLHSSTESLERDMGRIFDEIHGRRVVVYQSTNSGAGWRAIEVRSRRPSLRVRGVRRGYYSR